MRAAVRFWTVAQEARDCPSVIRKGDAMTHFRVLRQRSTPKREIEKEDWFKGYERSPSFSAAWEGSSSGPVSPPKLGRAEARHCKIS